jgi:hypothetical protein
MAEQTHILIEIDQFITEEEKRSLVAAAFREAAQRRSNEDFERILSNAAYALVQKEVDTAFDGNMAAVVREKAIAIIGKLSEYTVFKKADAWDRGESVAYKHLQSAMDEAKPVITAKVMEIVQAIDQHALHAEIGERIASAVIEKLTAKVTA